MCYPISHSSRSTCYNFHKISCTSNSFRSRLEENLGIYLGADDGWTGRTGRRRAGRGQTAEARTMAGLRAACAPA